MHCEQMLQTLFFDRLIVNNWKLSILKTSVFIPIRIKLLAGSKLLETYSHVRGTTLAFVSKR